MRISEREFVEEVRREAKHKVALRPRGLTLRQGIGDDCAILAYSPQKDLLVTTDFFLEGVHFRREWEAAHSVGHKALARALSDIAAMGGIPRYAFLSLALSRTIKQNWIQEFLKGFLELSESQKVILAGGDTSASPDGVITDVMVIGEITKGQAIRRDGSRAGDEIWVTGSLGNAALALSLLRGGKKPLLSQLPFRVLFYPQPRLHIGRYLRQRKLATAMIDISDGLSIDLARLCEESGTGARIAEEAIPRFPPVTIQQALHGGEDMELLFTVPPKRSAMLPKSIGGVPLTRIGTIIPGRKLWLVRGDGKSRPLPILGFQHF
ncbi:MAG: thiamine-phosphate kinase [Acidobacteria bacterium]|nr:thiamine-phosphate kinase [Acidobacteriota bacterium]